MCYSAQTVQAWQIYQRKLGVTIDIADFVQLYGFRQSGGPVKTPKAMDVALASSPGQEFDQVRALIEDFDRRHAAKLEQELFEQRTRLVGAERALQTKITKKAQNDQRVASRKIARAQERLADLHRGELKPRDSRIFPGTYGLVLVVEHGRPVVRPMRYQCRLAGKPANYDQRFPGTYNARRDSLEGYWAPAFGHTHGLMLVDAFYENVEGPNGKNQVLQFTPRTGEQMLVACLWSRWTDPTGVEPDLLSFAAVTDEPEPEVAAAGHDRTIINIRPEYIDAWLNPDPNDLAGLYRIMDDKQHPFYEHAIAA
ncbi:SOS response-associated peptidase family protein (plasmid) [Xanthomonas sontii]|uniref:SOS response-associated peptidase family protein n=1 Tax=Xanthomonas sontii TaxID=2650745 RepID=UPI003F83279F